jgi:hypothetical protein
MSQLPRWALERPRETDIAEVELDLGLNPKLKGCNLLFAPFSFLSLSDHWITLIRLAFRELGLHFAETA